MKKVAALVGVSGNMGREAFLCLSKSLYIQKIKVLLLNNAKERHFAARLKRIFKNTDIVFGDIANRADCDTLVSGADYVVNMAAVIPPLSDKRPDLADRCNRIGAQHLTDAVCALFPQPKLIHVSTVALYGHRNYLHPWGRVGDPLIPSTYDAYAASKLKGERYVLDAPLTEWAVLRQTAMLHNKMLSDNLKDGLMFHTTLNVPLEWVTAEDSGALVCKIIEADIQNKAEGFWKKVYNIGGGDANRITGYDTFDKGFAIIGGSAERFMKPCWNGIRNFHGLWFSDGDVLEARFHYLTETVDDYWKRILSRHPYYRLAKLLPPRLISALAIKRLLGDRNSPVRWINSRDNGRVKAYFGSYENIRTASEKWSDFPILSKGRIADGDIDYDALKCQKNALPYLLPHGYDETKSDKELDINDMREAAAFRGGECISKTMTRGDLYTKLTWRCHDGHMFEATPYAVLKAGHWCTCCMPEPWRFDLLSKKIPFFASVWYDTHAKGEDCKYYFDRAYRAKYAVGEQK